MLEGGVTAEELSKAKDGWLQEDAQERSNDDELASQIATHREVNRTFGYDADLERRVQSERRAQEIAGSLEFHQGTRRRLRQRQGQGDGSVTACRN